MELQCNVCNTLNKLCNRCNIKNDIKLHLLYAKLANCLILTIDELKNIIKDDLLSIVEYNINDEISLLNNMIIIYSDNTIITDDIIYRFLDE